MVPRISQKWNVIAQQLHYAKNRIHSIAVGLGTMAHPISPVMAVAAVVKAQMMPLAVRMYQQVTRLKVTQPQAQQPKASAIYHLTAVQQKKDILIQTVLVHTCLPAIVIGVSKVFKIWNQNHPRI